MVCLRRIGRRLKHLERVTGGKCFFKSFIKKLVEVFPVLL